jgi:DNA N-6-adenine-methyltransferase (Dam)
VKSVTYESPGNGFNEWLTPPKIIKTLGPFDTDPAASCSQAHESKPWATATTMYCKCDSGLDKKWKGRVWLNPPYDQAAQHWIKKLGDHGNGIALIGARVETNWFYSTVWEKADGIAFLHRRLKFRKSDGSINKEGSGRARFASVFVAFGLSNIESLKKLELPLILITKWRLT